MPELYLLDGNAMRDALSSGYVFTRWNGANHQVVVPFVFAAVWRSEIFEKELFQHSHDQMDPCQLPKFVLQVHQTTYKMLGLHAHLKRNLGSNSPIVREYRETGNGKMEVKSTIAELFAFATEGPLSLLNTEVWVNSDVFILDRPQKDTAMPLPDPDRNMMYETPDLFHGPDGYTPHAAELYKSSDSYTYVGENDAELSTKEIANELKKGHKGRDFLVILTPKDTDDKLELVDGVFRTSVYASKSITPKLRCIHHF